MKATKVMATGFQFTKRSAVEKARVTLCAVMKNEAYFLPEFLRWYRNLGVEEFFFLDDQSTDETREILSREIDVNVLESTIGYNDHLPCGKKGLHHWKEYLLNECCKGADLRILVDLDEFLCMPRCSRLNALDVDRMREMSIVGPMIDVYPKSIDGLYSTKPFSLNGNWYFDGSKHIELNESNEIVQLYAGATSRLINWYCVRSRRINQLQNLFKFGQRYAPFGLQYKPIIFGRSKRKIEFQNSHRASSGILKEGILPIAHFKYTSDLPRRISWALEGRTYARNSHKYEVLSSLVANMTAQSSNFCCSASMRFNGFDNFERTHNAKWIGW